jgi:hypothetical protein
MIKLQLQKQLAAAAIAKAIVASAIAPAISARFIQLDVTLPAK